LAFPGQARHRTPVPAQNIVDFAPTKETQLKLHALTDVCQTMKIRLAVPGKESKSKRANEPRK